MELLKEDVIRLLAHSADARRNQVPVRAACCMLHAACCVLRAAFCLRRWYVERCPSIARKRRAGLCLVPRRGLD